VLTFKTDDKLKDN